MENILKAFKSFSNMLEALPTDKDCREYLESLRWDNEPICPHCGVQDNNHYKLKINGEFKGLYKCKGCRKRFTVTVGTMFEGSHIPLKKWFIAIYMFSSHKKGISSHQLARDLGITQKSAWSILNKLKVNFANRSQVKFTGKTQAGETFIDGKNKNRNIIKKVEDSQGRSYKDKTPEF